MDGWASLVLFEKVLLAIALPFSLITVIQLILTFIGFGHADGVSLESQVDMDAGDAELSVDHAEMDYDHAGFEDVGQAEMHVESPEPDLEHVDGHFPPEDPFDFQKKPSFRFFTIRGAIACITIFSWAGIGFFRMGMGKPLALLLAFAAGLFAMLSVSSLYYLFTRMTESGNFNIYSSLEEIGEVYIPIDGQRNGRGKIHLKVNGSLRELDAITDHDSDISTGSKVRVISIKDQSTLIVEKI